MEVYGDVDESNEAASSSDERSAHGRRKKAGRCIVKLRIVKSEPKEYADSNNRGRGEQSTDDGVSSQKDSDNRVRSYGDSLQLKNTHGGGEDDEGYNAMNEEESNQSMQQPAAKTNQRFICSVCQKKFTSMKSLSGHMRCHPERNWRGIQPPSTAKNNIFSPTLQRRDDDDNDDSAGLEGSCASDSDHGWSLSSWPVTAKRCRSTTLQVTVVEDQEMISDAVENLLMLSQGQPKKMRGVDEFGDETGDFILNNAESGVSGGCSTKSMNIESRRESADGLYDLRQNSDESESKNMDFKKDLNYGLNAIKKIIKKKKKMRALKKVNDDSVFDRKKSASAAAAAARRYHCNVCNKNFASHQALGGHKASHKKGRYESSTGENLDVDGDLIMATANSVAFPGCNEHRLKPAAPASVHRCKICDKSFPSGQALGGHQRCHWSAPAELPVSSVTSQEEETKPAVAAAPTSHTTAVKNSGRQVLDFDLNQLPPMDPDDDQQLRIGLEYASCFRNSAAQ